MTLLKSLYGEYTNCSPFSNKPLTRLRNIIIDFSDILFVTPYILYIQIEREGEREKMKEGGREREKGTEARKWRERINFLFNDILV